MNQNARSLVLLLTAFVGCVPRDDERRPSTVRSIETPTVLVSAQPAANKIAVEASPKPHATTEAIHAAIRELLSCNQASLDGGSKLPRINSISQPQ